MHLNLLKVPSCAHFPRQSISLRRFFSSSSQFMSHFNAFNVINATYILFNSQFGHCQWSFNASSRTYECGAKFQGLFPVIFTFQEFAAKKLYTVLVQGLRIICFQQRQKMALRAFYFIRALTKALTYYYINRSQRHLLAAIENN